MTRTLTLMLSAASAALLAACSPENQVPVDEELTDAANAATGEVATQLPDMIPVEDDVDATSDDDDEDGADQAALPTTDIYLGDLGWTGNVPAITNVRNVTHHPGYDNQPAFLPGGQDFFYSAESPSGLTDVYLYQTGFGSAAQITDTPDAGEYSPRNYSATSGIYFVRQLADGSTQHLVHANANGSNPEPVLDLTTVGYYAFNADRSKVAMFILGDTFSLQIADLESGDIVVANENIGRSLYATPDGGGVVFTTGREDGGFRAMLYDFEFGESEYLFDLPGQSQDFALVTAPDGLSAAFASDAGTLYFRDANSADWTAVADLSSFGLEGVTRMAVSDDGELIAMVAADRSY